MEEDQEGPIGYLEKIAMITDAMEKIFPTSQSAILFELEEPDFYKIMLDFKENSKNVGRFKIDISGIEIIFMLKGYEPPVIEEKIGKLRKFFNLLSGKKSS
jgi:hypothetical protein